jgi:hypothetical protein
MGGGLKKWSGFNTSGLPMDAEDADAFAAGFLCQTETEFKLEQLKQSQQAQPFHLICQSPKHR